MPDDNLVRETIRAKKQAVQIKLQNGGGITPADNAWLALAILDLFEDAESSQAERYHNCEARLAYERGGWWRKLLQDKLATAALAAFMLGVIWAIVQAVQTGFVLP